MTTEKTVLSVYDYLVVGAMLLISAGIGVYFRFTGGRQKTTSEYFFAGKDMSILPVAVSLMASFLSSTTMIGQSADAYRQGMSMSYLHLGGLVSLVVFLYLFLPVLFRLKVATAFEYVEKRFGRLLRILMSLAFAMQMMLYMAVVVFAPSISLSAVTNLSTATCMVVIGLVCTFYSSLGGLKAVLWTDVLQAILMFGSIIVVLVKGFLDAGGVGVVFERAYDSGRLDVPSLNVDLTTHYTLWNIVLCGFSMYLSTQTGNQMQIQRLMSVRSLARSRIVVTISVFLGIIFFVLAQFSGLVMYSYFYECDPVSSPAKPISSLDQIFPFFALSSLKEYPGLPGLCICGIFSATLSTVSSILNSLASVTMEDLVRPSLKAETLTESRAAFLAKALTIAYGLLGLGLSFMVAAFNSLVQAAFILYGLTAGPTLAVFVLGLFSTKANEKGMVIGLLSSIALVGWMSFGGMAQGPKQEPLPLSTAGCPAEVLFSINETFTAGEMNVTDIYENVFSATNYMNNSAITEQERYIFPLYRVSYMWMAPIGFVVCFVVGYACSIIFKCATGKEQYIPPECLGMRSGKEKKKKEIEKNFQMLTVQKDVAKEVVF